MKKRFLAAILVVAMTCGIFAGCGGSGDSGNAKDGGGNQADTGNEGTEGSEGGADAPAADGDVTLRFLDVSPSPERQAYFEGVFADFKNETGITVNYESVPWDDAADKITVLGSSNQLPDILTVHEFWLGQLTSAGWINPLDDYVAENLASVQTTATKILMENEKNLYGHIYRIPDGLMTKGVFYRKDWAEEINYEIPTGDDWTWDAYLDLIAALTDPEQNRYGNSFRGARGAFDPIQGMYLMGYTGGYTYDEEGNFLMDTEECAAALQKWCDVYLKGYAPKDSLNWGFAEMVDNFAGGLTGTLLNDSEVTATLMSKMDESQWGVLPVPISGVDKKQYNSTGASYAYSVASSSEHPEEATQLIDFLISAKNNIEYCKMGGLIPIRTDVGDDPTYGPSGPYAVFLEELSQDNLVFPTTYGAFDYTDLHQGMLHTELQKCLLGQITAQDVLTNIGAELTTRMKAYLEANEGATVAAPLSLQ